MARPSILFELRYPTRWYTKLFMAILALAFFAVLATSAIAGFLVYRIVKPQRTTSEINLQTFPGRPDTVTFTVAGRGDREGYFFPGLRGAPTIVLCHGYESSRGELLTLVSALQDHQYNVFVFDFAGHGGSPGTTTFGYREADELRTAIDSLAARNDVDPVHFGLWGYNLGAYAALREAEHDPRVKALVLDSVYDKPEQMVKIGVERSGLGGFPLMVNSADQVDPIRLSLAKYFGAPTVHQKLQWMTFGELKAERARLEAQPALPGMAKQRDRDIMKVALTVQDKFSMAIAIFTFAFVAIPLGIKVSRRETSANLGIAVLLALGYYFLTVTVGWLDQHPEYRPDLIIWLPNVAFLGVGLWMLRRLDRA